MIKKTALISGLLAWLVSFQASALTADEAIDNEYNLNREKIDEIFRDKIEKISAREALPDEMRRLLISQADEIREFDMETLQRKMAIKKKHARDRDELKERLREDAKNRAKWLLEDEANFQKAKEERKREQENTLKEVREIQNSGPDSQNGANASAPVADK